MRYCGIDVSARAGNQQLVTLRERRGPDGAMELAAAFYEPGDVAAVARTVRGFGDEAVVGIDAPSAWRQDLLAAGAPLRDQLGLPVGRYERSRVCDALLFRRGLPLYPVPAAGEPLARWQEWMPAGLGLFEALAPLGLFRPDDDGAVEGRAGCDATRRGRLFETFPDAVFCVLLQHRPPPKRTPPGLQRRICALQAAGVVDDDGGLWRRSIDELDACAAAYAASAFATGRACWVGDPGEGLIVLPGDGLLPRYERAPPPARTPLA